MAIRYLLSVTAPSVDNPIKSVTSGVGDSARMNMLRVAGHLRALASGSNLGGSTWSVDARHTGVQASGTITMASSSGTVGAIINGVTVSVTWATSDTASSTALAAAINASSNALVKDLVTATASGAVTTITSVLPGKPGNCITLAATGTNVTASGARLTGGTETRVSMSF